jgi:hypothetical protein
VPHARRPVIRSETGIPLEALHFEQRNQIGDAEESGIPTLTTASALLENRCLGSWKSRPAKGAVEMMKPLPGETPLLEVYAHQRSVSAAL